MVYRSYGSSFGLQFTLTPWVKRLIIANCAVLVIGILIGPRLNLLLLDRWFAFHPNRVLVQPWGAFTYMFLHAGLGHLFFNMLALFFFGPPLESRWGSSEFIRYYVVCGLGGAALSFLFAQSAYVIGASAAVYGVMLAFAMNWPNAPIYIWGIFPVPAKILVGVMFAISFLSAIEPSGGTVAHMAHLGGLVAGFAYLKSDWRPGRQIDRWKKAARRKRVTIVTNGDGESDESKRPGRARRSGPDRREEALLDAVDRVLDKISSEGMSSLTPEEKALLDKVSKRRRSH